MCQSATRKQKVPVFFATVRASFCSSGLLSPKRPHKSVRWQTEIQKALLCDQLAKLGASAAVTNVTGAPSFFGHGHGSTSWASGHDGNIRPRGAGSDSGREWMAVFAKNWAPAIR
jgi:hypothetical protein